MTIFKVDQYIFKTFLKAIVNLVNIDRYNL